MYQRGREINTKYTHIYLNIYICTQYLSTYFIILFRNFCRRENFRHSEADD